MPNSVFFLHKIVFVMRVCVIVFMGSGLFYLSCFANKVDLIWWLYGRLNKTLHVWGDLSSRKLPFPLLFWDDSHREMPWPLDNTGV